MELCLLPQLDIIMLESEFNELVDRLTGSAGKRVGKIASPGTADRKLRLTHLQAPGLAFCVEILSYAGTDGKLQVLDG
jgi:predicted DNA-binding transcriptional regulator YafY